MGEGRTDPTKRIGAPHWHIPDPSGNIFAHFFPGIRSGSTAQFDWLFAGLAAPGNWHSSFADERRLPPRLAALAWFEKFWEAQKNAKKKKAKK